MKTARRAITFKRLEASSAEVLIQGANTRIGNDVNRPCDWEGGNGRARSKRFQQHQPESVRS
jgi:hypothetical protein